MITRTSEFIINHYIEVLLTVIVAFVGVEIADFIEIGDW